LPLAELEAIAQPAPDCAPAELFHFSFGVVVAFPSRSSPSARSSSVTFVSEVGLVPALVPLAVRG
jgi:hypothetical protein